MSERALGLEVLAVVPARGGSKGLPRKNLRPFAGAPLVAWSIAAAWASRLVDRVLVTTDDPEIREAGLAWGAEAPFLRPATLALDDTPDLPVFRHALAWLEENEGYRPDLVVQLRPTSPLRAPDLVDRGVSSLVALPQADSVRAVCPAPQTPYKMWRSEGPFLRPLLEDAGSEAFNRPRQSLPRVLWQTGQLDVAWRATIQERGSMTGDRILPLEVDPRLAADIDTPENWAAAEDLARRAELPIVRPSRTPGRAARVCIAGEPS
jgi:N-acylneuraminate cytidylyltransferase